jgi:hypothetical protein
MTAAPVSDFSQQFFNPSQKGPHVPRPHGRPRGAPDLDILFDAQDDIYKAHDLLKRLRSELDDEDLVRLLNKGLDQVGNTARLVRRYLSMHGSEEMFEQEGPGSF